MSFKIEKNTPKPELINDAKKKYMALKKLDLQTAELIKDEWHHAIISYFNLKPKYNGQFADILLSRTDIENIKRYYGVKPPVNYFSEEKKEYPINKKTPNLIEILDFYS
jgi:hypothetical protein